MATTDLAGSASGIRNAHDLEAFRGRVQQLYIQEGKQLEVVMEMLREEGCFASRNQYLRKIRSWKMEKNNKHQDMVEILETVKKNKAESQLTHEVFHIRGRTITVDEVMTYFQRRKRSSKAATRSAPVMPTLSLPEPLDSAQEFFRSINNAQLWLLKHFPTREKAKTDRSYSDISGMTNSIIQGVWLIHNGQSKIGGSKLERGFQAIQTIMPQAGPSFISNIFSTIVVINHYRFTDIAKMLVDYVHQVSCILFDQHHPMFMFTYQLSRHSHLWDVLQRGPNVEYEITVKATGKYSRLSLQSRYDALMTLRMFETPLNEISPEYESLLHDSLQANDREIFALTKNEYSTFLATHGEFSRGMSMLYELVCMINDPSTDIKAFPTTVASSADYSFLLMDEPDIMGFQENEAQSRKRYLQAEDIFKHAVKRAMDILGPEHLYTISISSKLERFYAQYGGPDEELQKQLEYLNKAMKDFELKPDP